MKGKSPVVRAMTRLDLKERPEQFKTEAYDKLVEWLLTPQEERQPPTMKEFAATIGLPSHSDLRKVYTWINHKYTKYFIDEVIAAMTAKDRIDMYHAGVELAKKSPVGKRVYHEVYEPEVFNEKNSPVTIVFNLNKPEEADAVVVDGDT